MPEGEEAVPVATVAKEEEGDEEEGREIEDGAPPSGQTVVGAPVPFTVVPKSKDEVDISDEEEDDEEEEAKAAFPRLEPEPDATLRENVVYVYGLDLLKERHLREIFSQFRLRFIEWINESSANIVFVEKESASKALETLSFEKPSDPPWRRTPDIIISDDVAPIFLEMRIATLKDAKRQKKGVPKAFVTPYPQREGARPQKRPRRVSQEEKQKRQKRGARFGEEQVSTLRLEDGALRPVPAGAAPRGTQAARARREAEKRAAPEEELDPEEIERRQKRSARFAEEAPEPAATGAGSTGEAAETSAAAAEPEAPAEPAPAETASLEEPDKAAESENQT